MRKYVEFLKRGMAFCFGGPLVLAIVYGILGLVGAVENFTVGEVVIGIFSSTLLAFIAAGMTVVYTVDKLSPFSAALIHGVSLYLDYILLYLFNGWLQSSLKPIMHTTDFLGVSIFASLQYNPISLPAFNISNIIFS